MYGNDMTSAKLKLTGKKITEVFFSEDYLTFNLQDDDGEEELISFQVEGDCCSHSYFHDFVGLEKLANGPITEFNTVGLDDDEFSDGYDQIQCYGYEIVTEHEKWGPQTTVFSFRNASNGYYGGWMDLCTPKVYPGQVKLTADIVSA